MNSGMKRVSLGLLTVTLGVAGGLGVATTALAAPVTPASIQAAPADKTLTVLRTADNIEEYSIVPWGAPQGHEVRMLRVKSDPQVTPVAGGVYFRFNPV